MTAHTLYIIQYTYISNIYVFTVLYTYISNIYVYTVLFWASPAEAAVRFQLCHFRILPVAELLG